MLRALEVLGVEVQTIRSEKSPNPKKSFLRYEFDLFKIDFLPTVPGLDSFSKAHRNRVVSIIDENEIHIMSKSDLIRSKENIARSKDLDDLKNLT